MEEPKFVDGWWWPPGERHMIDWLADPKNRLVIDGRPRYQGKKQMRCLDRLPLTNRRTMIDAGAHIGLWAHTFAPYFQKIEAFEPVEAHRKCFDLNVNGPHGIASKVTLHPFALGERSDMVHIRVNPSSTGDSWVQGKGQIQMHPIDKFGFTDVDFWKCDAEGYEEFILRGGEKTLITWKPVVCVEQKRTMAEKFGLRPMGAVKYLINLGYKTVDEISGDYILVHPDRA